ncbi:2-hydroxyisoflavanone dehydratase-like isoform X2 [Quercus lobata]|uniref:2-hydroxyisoflavanone dehydratase-like isoform X2 n=1 Tax=Quercus lobata TaxID=97700 RepID=UPI0012488A5E|nr:2-hydroxyisoflavanone dehydratase-like isoform X2 [Quercus lobata]
MATRDAEIIHDFRFFRVYKDGSVVLSNPTTDKRIPPSDDPNSGVRSKDIVISSEPAVSARVFVPRSANLTQKLPLLLYMHGGGFCMQSAFTPRYHNYVETLVAEANIIAVSVEYGLFPDRPIPACYEDSWAALKYVVSHVNGDGPEPWFNDHVDFGRVFIGGDSAGGNIAHNLAVRVGTDGLPEVKLVGVIMVHPFLGGTEDDQMWLCMCPENGGLDDPRMRPGKEHLARLGCERVLMFVAEKDHLFLVGKRYYEELKKSGWGGNVEIVEKAVDLIRKYVSFLKQE